MRGDQRREPVRFPAATDRIVVPAPAVSGLQRNEEFLVGQRVEQLLDGFQRGAVFQGVTGEQRLGGKHDGLPERGQSGTIRPRSNHPRTPSRSGGMADALDSKSSEL